MLRPQSSAPVEDVPAHAERARGPGWFLWLLGLAVLSAVVGAALHRAEGREFVQLVQRAEPRWLLLALALQAATYLAQGEIWRSVIRAGGGRLPLGQAFGLSLAKLFVDQTVPSAGVSGTLVLSRALAARGMARASISAAVVLHTVSYYSAYVIGLGAALAVAAAGGHAPPLLLLLAAAFLLMAAPLTIGAWLLSGRPHTRARPRLERLGPVRRILEFLREADPVLVRNPRLMLFSLALQGTIVLLDAGTVWSLLRSLGTHPAPGGVFVSFMISSLIRTMGVVPGGLGTFEAASILTLRMTGVPVAAALSATLLFRVLSFWLPMIPGLWYARAGSGAPASTTPRDPGAYWATPVAELMARYGAGPAGLGAAEAAERLRRFGRNEVREHERLSRLGILVRQLSNPLLGILVFAAAASALTGEWTDSAIVVAIVLATVAIGFSREYRAHSAAAALRQRIQSRARVVRDGRAISVPIQEVVPGDVVQLAAGSLVPADAIVIEAVDCHVNEAVLTGESFPVEKRPGTVPAEAALARRTNCLWLGTNVHTGTATALVVSTGRATQFGAIAHRLAERPVETEFDRGILHFGYLLTVAMLVMVLFVFGFHVLNGRPPVETLLFSIALAVGLSPELLPAILSVNLARGASLLAREGVLVRRLNALENLGSMDVLCTDKTGTLTEGVVRVEGAWDGNGTAAPAVLEKARINAALEAGLGSPLDDALLEGARPDLSRVRKLAEIPFDFTRRRVSVVVSGPDGVELITKGAFAHVVADCTRDADGSPLDDTRRGALERRYEAWSGGGIRVLAVATRPVGDAGPWGRDLERDLTFRGFVTFSDRTKPDVAETLRELARLGVSVKVITGDNRLVARHVAAEVGMDGDRLLTGDDLDRLDEQALWHSAERTQVFAEVDPNQKERIIRALRRTGHVVGFLGDGVNDAPAMHAADTSLSVDQAVDVAREAADFVLLERDLAVIRRGILDGRRTLANTLKYVLTTTSANLGNMLSMAAASLFLPFLPLLASQILLNNFLSDIPAVGLADDSVDPEMVERPRRWDVRMIGRFMVEFGLVSSLFDFVTFGGLLALFHAGPELFRTGWFMESLLTELVIALVVRTRRPFFRSRPGRVLLLVTVVLVPITFAIPYLPFARELGFVQYPGTMLAMLVAITVLYIGATELLKRGFYRRAT